MKKKIKTQNKMANKSKYSLAEQNKQTRLAGKIRNEPME